MQVIGRNVIIVISISFIIVGGVLLLYYLNLIPLDWQEFAVNLWPVSLIVVGLMFVRDSIIKNRYLKRYEIKKKSFSLTPGKSGQASVFDVFFSYGRLHIRETSQKTPQLIYEQLGPMPEPEVTHQEIGKNSIIRIKKQKPYFSTHFQIKNKWFLELLAVTPQQLTIHLHDADLRADLRRLAVERFTLKANSGVHTIYFGKTVKNTLAQVYSSSSLLSISTPPETFLILKLLNPFCKVEYPQGDFIKKEDGTIISNLSGKNYGVIELTVDGALKQLTLDIEETTPV
jgi:hypothetical protein